MILEVCVDSVESARAAEAGGAQRIELCSDLLEGGITPSSGLIEVVRSSIAISTFIMVRPRGGDFYYTADEFNVMRKDIDAARSFAADGVVLGLLRADRTVDVERTRELVERARPMQVTFHRAIDLSPNIEDSLEQVITTGADRVLTSGGKKTALEGAECIAGVIANCRQRIGVMVCGGVRATNVEEIARRTGAREFHASLRRRVESPVAHHSHGLRLGSPGSDEYARYAVSANEVRAMLRVFEEHLSIDDDRVSGST